jgi:hypothetical protein
MLRTVARFAVVAAAFLSLAATSLAATSLVQAGRVVYVLAGQSNIEYLTTGSIPPTPTCGHSGALHPQVTYFQPGVSSSGLTAVAFTPAPHVAVRTLGEALGAHHAGRPVEIVQIAQSGSALLASNFVGFMATYPALNGAWVDETNLFQPLAWANLLAPVLASRGLGAADELHIVWGQGESDFLAGMNTSEDVYSFWAQVVFAQLAFAAGKTTYVVHLVTPGALYSSAWPGPSLDRLRDAYFHMPSNVIVFGGFQPTIQTAAHHYDLEHADAPHLSHCGYVELAGRIAAGIAAPASLARVSGATSVSGGVDISIATSGALATAAFGQASNKFFEVRVGGAVLAPSDFEVAAGAAGLTVRVPAGGVTASNFSVRHVAGSGYTLDWATMPTFVDAASGLPLEPFVLP